MASENENHESEQNQIQDNLSGGSNDTKEPPKEPSDNPDDFISYNNNDSDEFGDNHSMLNENFIGYGNHNTADIMEEPSAYNNSLMSLLCSNDGDNSQKVKETTIAKVVQQAPEKAGPATSSAEKNILNGQFLKLFFFPYMCIWYSSSGRRACSYIGNPSLTHEYEECGSRCESDMNK